MHCLSHAISMNVPDVEASAAFLERHFAFARAMAADGFVSLTAPSGALNLIYLRPDLPTLEPEALRGAQTSGLLVVFVVDDIDREHDRLVTEGVQVVTPLRTEPWGERFFQMVDANGVIYQLVQWVEAPDPTSPSA